MDLVRNLKIDSVSRLHPNPPLQLGPQETVGQAVALMREKKVGCVLVCQANQVAGIFTERDLLVRVLAVQKPLGTTLGECMTPNPTVVYPKEPIGVAIRRMQEGRYRHLPVVDEMGRPVGILSVKQIIHYLVEHYPPTVYNQPPDPGVVPQLPEGA